MTYEERIRAAYPAFSKSFARLADFLLDSYLEAAFMTATELGQAINVDATTVVRFSQQLGYAGYPELLREIREKIKSQLLAQPQKSTRSDSIESVVETTINELDNIFGQTRKLLDPQVIQELIKKIGAAGKTVLLPDPLSSGAARTLLGALERGSFLTILAETGLYDLARTVRLAKKGDVYIAFQAVQESSALSTALLEARKAGAVTAAFLGGASFASAQSADLKLFAYAQPSGELTAMSLTAMAYTLGQALRWQFASRYTGADQAIHQLAHRFKNPGA